jgi:viologen exporter family transport system permease protein
VSRARRLWRKFVALTQVGLASWVEYRAELYLWALTGVLPLILLGVWRQASAGGAFALGPAEFTRYFLMVFMVRQATIVWVIWEFEGLVVGGALSSLLLQPQSLGFRFVVFHLTERLARLPLALVVLFLGFWAYPDARFLPSIANAGLAFLAIVASFATRFVIQYAFAMVAFWSERASSLEELWFLLYVPLAGMLAPLDVYPESVRRVAEWTPFPYFVYFPVQILIGHAVHVGRGFAVLFVWALAGCLLQRVLWKRGLRRYSAMGA